MPSIKQQIKQRRKPSLTEAKVAAVDPLPDSLASSAFPTVDYHDAFSLTFAEDDRPNIDEFTRRYFTNQPWWLTTLSLNTTKSRALTTVNNTDFSVGTKVGSWEVTDRGENEIVFGDSMGFMTYRLNFHIDPASPDHVTAETVVHYNWRRVGGLYFSLVKPGHRRFVPLALRCASARRLTEIGCA